LVALPASGCAARVFETFKSASVAIRYNRNFIRCGGPLYELDRKRQVRLPDLAACLLRLRRSHRAVETAAVRSAWVRESLWPSPGYGPLTSGHEERGRRAYWCRPANSSRHPRGEADGIGAAGARDARIFDGGGPATKVNTPLAVMLKLPTSVSGGSGVDPVA